MAKKISLDQAAINQFFFLHVEKVILGVAAVLLFLFFWFGFSTPSMSGRSPKGLVDLATSAKNYVNAESWPAISEYRKGDTSAPERIRLAADQRANVKDYKIGLLAGTRVKDAGLRRDPELFTAEKLQARAVVLPLLVKSDLPMKINQLKTPAEMNPSDNRRPGVGSGNSASDDDGSANEKKEKKEIKELGDFLEEYHQLELPGVRPKNYPNLKSTVMSAIQVVGVVPFEKQWGAFDDALLGTKSYFPARDRPAYMFLQVARQVEGEEWNEDYYQEIYRAESNLFAGQQSPEVIDPNYYDPVLTRPLPPITVVDFRQIASHPEVPLRSLKPSFLWAEEKKDVAFLDAQSLMNQANSGKADPKEDKEQDKKDPKAEEIEKMKGSVRSIYDAAVQAEEPLADSRLVRFFDFNPPASGKVRYKVRLWVLDSNDPPESFDPGNAAGEKKRDTPSLSGAGDNADQGVAGGDGIKKGAFKLERLGPDTYTPDVAKRLVEKKNLPPSALPKDSEGNPIIGLYNARPTEWSEPSEFVSAGGSGLSQMFAGAVMTETDKVGGVEIRKSEPVADVVASFVSPEYMAVIPAKRMARRGELLNFVAPKANLLHPTDWKILQMENADIKSDLVVVDMMGGRELEMKGALLTNPPEGYATPDKSDKPRSPGEVLVMDSAGNFRIRRTDEDAGKYRASLFLPDDTREYGVKKKEPDRGRNSGNNNNPGGN